MKIRATDITAAYDTYRDALTAVSTTRAAHEAACTELDAALAAYEAIDAAYRAQIGEPPDAATEEEAARFHATFQPR